MWFPQRGIKVPSPNPFSLLTWYCLPVALSATIRGWLKNPTWLISAIFCDNHQKFTPGQHRKPQTNPTKSGRHKRLNPGSPKFTPDRYWPLQTSQSQSSNICFILSLLQASKALKRQPQVSADLKRLKYRFVLSDVH